MAKVIIAFVAGLAVATLVISLFNVEPETLTSDSVNERASSRESAEISAPKIVSTSRGDMPNEAVTTTESVQRDVPDALVDEQIFDELPPPALPIDRPPEFGFLAELPPNFFPHLIEREPYDPNWAPKMESQISQFLEENPDIEQSYGSPTLTCRTTMCELAFVAYGLGERLGLEYAEGELPGLAGHFKNSISDFYERPEFEQFDLMNGNPMLLNRTEDGVTTMLWQLIAESDD